MATVDITEDERYPFYRLHGGVTCTVSDQTLERWTSVLAEFEQVQDEMAFAYDAAEAALPPRPKRDQWPTPEKEPLKTIEYTCLACDFVALDMIKAHDHEEMAPSEHPVVMRTKVVD